MEKNDVVISVDDLRYKIKEVVDNFRDEIGAVLVNVEDYIKFAQVLEEEEDTPKFKVGDVITGKDADGYTFTTKDSVLVVTDVCAPHNIKVKVLAHKLYFDQVGEEYEVYSEDFKLITDIL